MNRTRVVRALVALLFSLGLAVPAGVGMTATAPQGPVAQAGDTPLAAAVGAPDEQACTWTGTWAIRWYANTDTMTLTQSGNQVTGSYPSNNGRVSGTVAGNRVTGTWTEGSSSGRFEWTIDPSCNSFTGTYGHGTSTTGGPWSGTRVGSAPTGQATGQAADLTGLWRDNGRANALYRIRQVGDQVYWSMDATAAGSYANVFVGTVRGDRIEGRWVDLPGSPALGGGALTLRIASNNRLVKVAEPTPPYGASEWVRQGSQTPLE
jgi:hypothetical protein